MTCGFLALFHLIFALHFLTDYRAIESVVTLLPGLSMTCFTSDDAIIDDNRALEMREDFFLEIVAVQPLDLVLINNEALTVFIMDNDGV